MHTERIESTKLLISVRDAAEAQVVYDFADILDIKDPSSGSLGRPHPEIVNEILAVARHQRPISIALGELLDYQPGAMAEYFSSIVDCQRIQFAKLGLHDCSARKKWRTRWEAAIHEYPAHIQPVMVAYLDEAAASSPRIEEVIVAAAKFNCNKILLDTYHKHLGNWQDHMAASRLRELISMAAEREIDVVLAGSIMRSDLKDALDQKIYCIGVRSAVCAKQRRTHRVEASAVRSFREAFEQAVNASVA